MKVEQQDSDTDISLLPCSYKQYGYRWISTGIYLLSAFLGSMMVQTCTPIVEELSEAYGVTKTVVKLTALVFMVSHPLFTMLANWVVESLGLKIGLNIGSTLVIVGLGLRILVNFSFWWMIVGSVVCSAGNVFVLNTPAKVASNWWFVQNRVAVTSICTFASFVSGAVGTLMPVFLFDKENPKESFRNLMIIQEALIGSVFFLNIILFRERPPSPPSYSSILPRETFLKAMPLLINNPQYLKLFGSVALVMGAFNAFYVNIESFLKPFGFTSKDVSLISASSTALSIISLVISILFVRKYRKFKLVISSYMCMAVISVIGMTFSLYLEKLGILVSLCGLVAFAINPAVTTCIELGCEIVYPVGEATSTGTLLAGGQISSFIFGIILSELVVDGEHKSGSIINGLIIAGIIAIGFFLILWINVDLKREKEDLKHI